jgi:site-specific DNA-cytosine methylase
VNGYNVLSLFDGISCGQVALQRAGIPVNKYYASEIDQRAVKVTQKNWPRTIQFGDVTKIRKEHFMSEIDILIGGSPCQGFSFAGKQLNFDDPRSKLFFEFVRLRDELKPKYFFLENVRMKKESQDVISKYLGVEPIFVNSALVSAQNRPRLYWTNIPGFTMPCDKGIKLADIIDKRRGIITKVAAMTERRTEEAKKIRSENMKNGRDFSPRRYKELVERRDNKANCLTATIGREQLIKVNEELSLLTSLECERLQGLPDNYSNCLSSAARYHALGNGWQVDTIIEFFKHIPH